MPKFSHKSETIALASYPVHHKELENPEFKNFEKVIEVIKDIRKAIGIFNLPKNSNPKLYFVFEKEDKTL